MGLTVPCCWTGVVAVLATGIVAGCGSSGPGATASTHRGSHAAAGSHATAQPAPGGGPSVRTIPTPPPTGIAADPAAVAVIREWSDALRRGNIRGAAGYFALPSLMINGPVANGNAVVINIRSRADAEAANAALPCGAKFISADQRGRYVNALFRLTDRPGPGGGCGAGTGQTARTNFVVSRGRIVEWIRALDDPGDNAGPSGPGPNAPGSTPGSTPAV
jgi:hypothetical protein